MAKHDLIDEVWPGVTVDDKNLAVQISALRRVLDQDRAAESCIQTVPGRGYRLTVPVMPVATASLPDSATGAVGRHRRWGLPTCLAVAIIIAVVSASLALQRPVPIPPPRLSLVVLPFRNVGSDDWNDSLAREVTADLTNDLAAVHGITLIAAAPDQVGDPRSVGAVLGVRYALSGNVRRIDDSLRVNARLISVETGAYLWSERLEESIRDDGEGVIARRLSQAITVAMIDRESARSKQERPSNPDAFDLQLQARSLALHNMGVSERDERLLLLERAVRLDPRSILALTQVSVELARRYAYSEVGANSLERAANLVREARAINPNHVAVLDAAANLLRVQGRTTEAIAAYRQLLEEYPNAVFAYNELGACLIYAGRSNEALDVIRTAIRRDPRHPKMWARYAGMGLASLMLERDQDAVAWTQRALAANPSEHPFMRANLNVRLAAAYARLGELELARRALGEANRIWPYDTVRMHWPDDPHSPTYAAQIARFQDGLRLAGHRSHADEDADFGVVSDATLRRELAGLTPTDVPGAKLIRTRDLERFLADRNPIVIDSMLYWWGLSIPGAIGLKFAGMGGDTSDAVQDRLRSKIGRLTNGNRAAPIVVVSFNSERFDGRNLALRLAALGFTDVYWYRGGREAWAAAGLPETVADVQDW